MQNNTIIFWFRQDLRVSDNPGLAKACSEGKVIPIYILDTNILHIGEAARWWLHQSLKSLNNSLDSNLNFYKGDSLEILRSIVKSDKSIKAIYWNRCYEPSIIKNDKMIKESFAQEDLECKSFNASLLWEPWDIQKDNDYYKVYTPFYRKGCLESKPPRSPIDKPLNPKLIKCQTNVTNIDDLGLLPEITWYKKFENIWDIGEKGAHKVLSNFLSNGLKNYKESRNHPARPNTSRLSPYLHFGEISPNVVWYEAQKVGLIKGESHDLDHFLSELAWREFAHYTLYHFPELPYKNFQKQFDHFPWENDDNLFNAWKKGQTGYPIVDAGMRQLWQTGYLHNRMRMVVASFLIKNLLQDWRKGLAWFDKCLLDADMANNSFGWQWVAGSGFDAAPYFRIFNPVLQGEKFDSEGKYTKHFVPELSRLSNDFLFKPWTADQKSLEEAGIELGKDYPLPLVDIKASRDKSLKIYHDLKNKNS